MGRRDGVLVIAVAALARLAVALWAGARFVPIADGVYYATLAERLAGGAGYTWLWPDGAVTYAAHYPVGYPALLALAFRFFGAGVTRAIAVNALLGVLAAGAGWGLASRAMGRRAALVCALAAALEPATLLYLPAVMTEGATAHLLVIAAWVALRARESEDRRFAWLAALGVLFGAMTLVRPQSLLLAPLFGLVACASGASLRVRLGSIAAVLALTLAICAPWTARNCVRMKSCALVSVNGGWNLWIGVAPGATGHWAPIDVPAACATVWDEAGKDACFAREARAAIARDPTRFFALVPSKLSATFDYGGAAPWYLHESAPALVSARGKEILAGLETLFHRAALALALAAAGLGPGPRRNPRVAIAAVGGAFALGGLVASSAAFGWVAHLAFPVVVALHGRAALRLPVLLASTALAITAVAVVHAVFFGAGRYGIVVYPLVTLSAGAIAAWRPSRSAF